MAQAFIKEVQADQSAYVSANGSTFFQELSKSQKPRTTVVTYFDSRVHTNMLDSILESDLFMVRNIGNQLATAKDYVQYGMNYLGSSLLLVIGYSSCGAIKAAGGDYSTLEDPIEEELDTINIAKGSANPIHLQCLASKLGKEILRISVFRGKLICRKSYMNGQTHQI